MADDQGVERLGYDTARCAAMLIGGLAGLLAWLPAPDADRICPPPGEGRAQCVLNEVWIAGLLHVLLGAAVVGLALALIRMAPRFARRQRAWARAQARPVPLDPELLAARWDRMERWAREAQEAPPLPVGDDGRLDADELRDWLAATAPAAAGRR
ncbi:MAG TPA: hypothetical protein VFR97_11860 [Capillimicrobium sp.]|nr:hypothetical protein [Capillimicrobium sp.]